METRGYYHYPNDVTVRWQCLVRLRQVCVVEVQSTMGTLKRG